MLYDTNPSVRPISKVSNEVLRGHGPTGAQELQ
jgi:hypothetical protein